MATIRQCSPGAVSSAGNAYFTLSGNVTVQCGNTVISLAAVQERGLEARSTGAKVPNPRQVVLAGRLKLGLAV